MKKRYLFTGLLVGSGVVGYKYLRNTAEIDGSLYPREKKVYEFEGEYSEITIGETSLPIYVKKSQDFKTRVICFEGEKDFYDFTDDDQLIIIPHNARDRVEKAQNFFGKEKGYLELQIPADLMVDLIVFNKNGDINIEDCVLESINVRNISGATVVNNVKASSEIVVSGKNGIINLDCSSAKTIMVENVNGTIVVFNVKADKELEITSKNGVISGYDIISEGMMIIENKNGAIELQGLDFDVIAELVNKNGFIDVEFIGSNSDYSIETIAKSEKNINIPETTGEKPIVVETKNGSVRISFENIQF